MCTKNCKRQTCKKAIEEVSEVEAGKDLVVALTKDGRIYRRRDVSFGKPIGDYWLECDFDRSCSKSIYKDISVSKRDHFWAVEDNGDVVRKSVRYFC